jgi:hypothetical protein
MGKNMLKINIMDKDDKLSRLLDKAKEINDLNENLEEIRKKMDFYNINHKDLMKLTNTGYFKRSILYPNSSNHIYEVSADLSVEDSLGIIFCEKEYSKFLQVIKIREENPSFGYKNKHYNSKIKTILSNMLNFRFNNKNEVRVDIIDRMPNLVDRLIVDQTALNGDRREYSLYYEYNVNTNKLIFENGLIFLSIKENENLNEFKNLLILSREDYEEKIKNKILLINEIGKEINSEILKNFSTKDMDDLILEKMSPNMNEISPFMTYILSNFMKNVEISQTSLLNKFYDKLIASALDINLNENETINHKLKYKLLTYITDNFINDINEGNISKEIKEVFGVKDLSFSKERFLFGGIPQRFINRLYEDESIVKSEKKLMFSKTDIENIKSLHETLLKEDPEYKEIAEKNLKINFEDSEPIVSNKNWAIYGILLHKIRYSEEKNQTEQKNYSI